VDPALSMAPFGSSRWGGVYTGPRRLSLTVDLKSSCTMHTDLLTASEEGAAARGGRPLWGEGRHSGQCCLHCRGTAALDDRRGPKYLRLHGATNVDFYVGRIPQSATVALPRLLERVWSQAL